MKNSSGKRKKIIYDYTIIITKQYDYNIHKNLKFMHQLFVNILYGNKYISETDY